jgi:uncharacterized protein
VGTAFSCYFFESKPRVTMSMTTTTDQADRIVGVLRAHEAELRRGGIRHLSLFGSFARGDAVAVSDIDLAAEFDPAARMDLFRLTALERRIAEILGRRVTFCPNWSSCLVCARISIATGAAPSRHDPARALADIIENAERMRDGRSRSCKINGQTKERS